MGFDGGFAVAPPGKGETAARGAGLGVAQGEKRRDDSDGGTRWLFRILAEITISCARCAVPSPNLRLSACTDGRLPSRTRFDPDVTPHFMPRHCGFSRNRGPDVMHESLSALSDQAIWRYVTRGTAIWEWGERRVEVPAGTVLATRQPSGGRLRLPDGAVETIWITVQGAPALAYFDRITQRFGAIHALAPASEAVRRAEEMVRAARRNTPQSPFAWSERTFGWMTAWHRQLEEQRAPLVQVMRIPPEESRRLLTAARSVKSFAAQVGYSQSHLTRVMARTWRETPGKVFRRVRLEEAARRLRDEAKSVAAVAASAGYSSVPAFITAFKGKFGETPAAYRRSRR